MEKKLCSYSLAMKEAKESVPKLSKPFLGIKKNATMWLEILVLAPFVKEKKET